MSRFGEEGVTPERAAGLGYAGPSETRKGYTGYEKDTESGLDFAQARYYNARHGRFTSVDPLTASMDVKNPQTLNRYAYVLNSPYKYVDPLGLIPQGAGAAGGCGAEFASCEGSSDGLSDDVREFNQQYEDRLRDNWDRNRAQAAANRGDWDTFWDIMRGNDTLSAYDQNGVRLRDPNEPTITVTARVGEQSTTTENGPLEELQNKQISERNAVIQNFQTWVNVLFGMYGSQYDGTIIRPVPGMVKTIQDEARRLFNEIYAAAKWGVLDETTVKNVVNRFLVGVTAFAGPKHRFTIEYRDGNRSSKATRSFKRNDLNSFGTRLARSIFNSAVRLAEKHHIERVILKQKLLREGSIAAE